MNAVSAVRIRFENLRSLGFAGIGAAYAPVGTPFANPIRLLKVNNLTNANLLVSFNGIDDQDVVAANSAYVFDFGVNKSDMAGLLEQPAQTRFYVKSETSDPTMGTLYVTTIYASEV